VDRISAKIRSTGIQAIEVTEYEININFISKFSSYITHNIASPFKGQAIKTVYYEDNMKLKNTV